MHEPGARLLGVRGATPRRRSPPGGTTSTPRLLERRRKAPAGLRPRASRTGYQPFARGVGSSPADRVRIGRVPGRDSGRARPRRGGATLCCVGPRAPRGQAESGSGSDLACEPSDQFSTQAGRAGPLSALVRRRLIRERTPRAVAGVASQLRCRRSWPRCARPVDRLARVDSNDKWGSVLSELETKWVNNRSTRLRYKARSQQKRFRVVMPPCELSRGRANQAGTTLNPKVEGSNPSRPTRHERPREPASHCARRREKTRKLRSNTNPEVIDLADPEEIPANKAHAVGLRDTSPVWVNGRSTTRAEVTLLQLCAQVLVRRSRRAAGLRRQRGTRAPW